MQAFGMHNRHLRISERMVSRMKRRSGFTVMMRLIGLVKPLCGFMVLAIIMGLIGHLTASFITIFGGFAVAELLGIETSFTLTIFFEVGIISGMYCTRCKCIKVKNHVLIFLGNMLSLLSLCQFSNPLFQLLFHCTRATFLYLCTIDILGGIIAC